MLYKLEIINTLSKNFSEILIEYNKVDALLKSI